VNYYLTLLISEIQNQGRVEAIESAYLEWSEVYLKALPSPKSKSVMLSSLIVSSDSQSGFNSPPDTCPQVSINKPVPTAGLKTSS